MPKDTTQTGQVGKPTSRTVADASTTHKKEGIALPLILPRISDDVAGGIFAGICRGEYGQEDYALILLPGDVKLPNWDKSMEWAAAAGGDLPSPSEQQLLRANLPEKFQPVGYWSNKQHESDSASAWFQTFGDGCQYDGRHESAALHAVAVSRLPIQSLINSFCSRQPASASSTPLPIDARLDAVTSLTRLCILFGVIEQLAEEGSHIADTAGMGVELATEYADKLTISATNGGTHHG